MGNSVLVLNAGSSSVKFSTYRLGPAGTLVRIFRGELEGIGTRPHLLAADAEGRVVADTVYPVADVSSRAQAIQCLGDFLKGQQATDISAVGHRVVHGGPSHAAPAVVTAGLLEELEALVPWAPLHQPACLDGIRAMAALDPGVPQVACFDTAFHQRMPELAHRFALPDSLFQQGVRRYGFHGLSYEYIAGHLAEAAPRLAQGRVVVAHLGNGASMCALQGGRSVDTTMGFSVLDGLPMGTAARGHRPRGAAVPAGPWGPVPEAAGPAFVLWGWTEGTQWGEQRHARLAGQRGAAGESRSGVLRLPRGTRAGCPLLGAGRPGRPGFHRWHWRARRGGALGRRPAFLVGRASSWTRMPTRAVPRASPPRIRR